MEIKRASIYWVNLDPTRGAEIKKMRPCVIVSPNSMNENLATVIVAPCTRTIRESYPTRVTTNIDNKRCQIVLDQIRTIDKRKVGIHLDNLDAETSGKVFGVLQEIFTE